MEQAIKDAKVKTFTDFLRVVFKNVIDPIAAFLNRLGLKPNTVTLSGLIGHTAAAYLIAQGEVTWGGLLILVMAPVDALDGAMARLRGEPSKFGAFIDSVTDRYSELVLFGGLLVYFLNQNNWLGCGLVYLAAAGSVMVSYTRARAETLGFDGKIGLLSRVERYIILIPSLIFNLSIYGLGIIAVLANFTAVQRIWSVRKQAHETMNL
ncbi:CDP-alcohol phosphatidyltransferase family protein [Ornatilinea apprima]|uniref:CDP-alcohol phosphatidyltransferase family protein n=1 Tax=Ornatilinea apprima TaxID=1134406 RepID=UPI000B2DF413|nr:CDP-alcohol phosphatidyltransferase family protein [Ornatilinea apprima]